jgi:hypothetical protein
MADESKQLLHVEHAMHESLSDVKAMRREEDDKIRRFHEKGWGLSDIARFTGVSEAKVLSVIASLKSHN